MAVASPWTGSSTQSCMWRPLARTAEDIARAFGRSSNSSLQLQTIKGHLEVAGKAHESLSRALRQSLAPEVAKWVASLQAAAKLRCIRWIMSLEVLADTRAKKLEAAMAKCRLTEWKIAVGATPDRSDGVRRLTKAGFRWVKGIAKWRSSPIGPNALNDGVPQPDDADGEHFVESQAKEWAQLWREEAQYEAPSFSDDPRLLEALSPWAIRTAATSFPVGTGLGHDNIAPGEITRLSESALVALVALFAAFELIGNWCLTLDLVLIGLLPKGDGGFRAVGLYPTIIRLWMRALVCLVRAWEQANASPSLYGGSGMGAQFASWQAAFIAEIAALSNQEHAQTCGATPEAGGIANSVKAFETLPKALAISSAVRARGRHIQDWVDDP
eukprot:12431495-Karenia_brevis.AAC.1